MGRRPKSKLSFLGFLRPLFTIVVLSAFVLGISLFVKTLANSDLDRVISSLEPLLSKLNIDEKKAGVVAGEFVARLSQTGVGEEALEKKDVASSTSKPNIKVVPPANDSLPDVTYTIAFLADSHDSSTNLSKALTQAKDKNAQFIFYLGDFTNYGELETLERAKKVMDDSGIEYLALPGDHDLYKSVGPQNFIEIFGSNHFAKIVGGKKFVGLDNSANFTQISAEIMSWFDIELTDADFVILSQPLYHPNFNVVMGVVSGEENVTVRAQALELLKKIRNSNVKAIIAADQHISSINKDPVRSSLDHVVVGALTDERNLQTPRFSVFNIYKDSTYQIKDVLIE